MRSKLEKCYLTPGCSNCTVPVRRFTLDRLSAKAVEEFSEENAVPIELEQPSRLPGFLGKLETAVRQRLQERRSSAYSQTTICHGPIGNDLCPFQSGVQGLDTNIFRIVNPGDDGSEFIELSKRVTTPN